MSPHAFRKAFLAAKPTDLTWYAYDVEVRSPTLVAFVVYDMRDTCWGGIGREVARFGATVGVEVTNEATDREALRLAARRRTAELDAEEQKIVRAYADEILALAAATGTAKTPTAAECEEKRDD